VYDPTSGDLINQLDIPDGFGSGGVDDIFWLDDGGSEALGMVFNDAHFEVFHPESGIAEPINGLELYSLAAPDGPVSLLYAPVLGDGNDWAVREGDSYTALPVSPELYALGRIALSPTGDAVAYVDDQVYVWRNGQATPVPMTQLADPYTAISLAWSPLSWRAFRGDVPILGAAGEPITCPGFMFSRMVVGGRGRVSDDLPNNLRQEPSTSSQRIGEIPSGAEFDVLAGPICGENLAWWQVNYNGIVGWTAEGQGNEYWLEPLS
jgi:hypothetical protein